MTRPVVVINPNSNQTVTDGLEKVCSISTSLRDVLLNASRLKKVPLE